MAKKLYDVENLDGQTMKFTVRPLPLYGWFRKFLLLLALAGLFVAFSAFGPTLGVVGTLLCVLFVAWTMTGGSWNRGRRFTQFTAGPGGITFLENGTPAKTLPAADIEWLYLKAPKVGQVMVHSNFGGGSAFTGVSSTGGMSAGLAARSWQVIVQVRGVEHWIAGGLTEPMASSLSMQVQRALTGR